MRLLLLLFTTFLFSFACNPSQETNPTITLGASQFEEYIPLLKNKNVGLVVNQTSVIGNTHLVDTLLSLGVEVRSIFAPEHGFRGVADAGEHVQDGIDTKTGVSIISLYGEHKKPTTDDLLDIDVIIFDIQDVGVRFYTYISTMHYVMEACAEQNKKFIVLDRPNPNGHYVAGPVLDLTYKSFVGMHPIPIVHGLTVGELAQMINGEGWMKNNVKCDLSVIKMKNYTHETPYSLPIKPSPNLPNDRSIALYPSLCLLEPTIMSIGRGTSFPFQVVGYPDSTYGNFVFTPVSTEGASKYPKHQDKNCYGEDLRINSNDSNFTLKWIIKYYQKYNSTAFITSENFFDKLAGNSTLRTQLKEGMLEKDIEATWQDDLNIYLKKRSNYLLYVDFK